MQRFLGILLLAGGLLSAVVFAGDLVSGGDDARSSPEPVGGPSARVEAIAGLAVSLVCGAMGVRLVRTAR